MAGRLRRLFEGEAYGDILDNDALNLESATGVTFVARVKRDGNTGGFIMQRMGFGYCEDDEFDFGLTDDGRVYSDFNGPSCTYKGILSINSIPADTWTTIAANWDQATQTLNVYINGILDTTTGTPVTSIQNTSTPIRIGMPPFDYLKSFIGSLDYLRIYRRTLSPGEHLLLANF